MTTLENTISIMEALPETDLIKIQDLAQKLFQQRKSGCPFPLKSKDDIYKDLEISRQQAAVGDYQNAGEFIAEVRKEYGI